ncbi:MAG: hypothetical protein ACO27L_02485 [Schleiferiaceae bacterium]
MTEPTQPDALLDARRPSESTYQCLVAYSAACRGLAFSSKVPAELRVAVMN